jgi:hypothetical protein
MIPFFIKMKKSKVKPIDKVNVNASLFSKVPITFPSPIICQGIGKGTVKCQLESPRHFKGVLYLSPIVLNVKISMMIWILP